MELFGPPNINKLKQKGDIPAIIKATRHKNTVTRLEAVKAISELGSKEAIPALLERLNLSEELKIKEIIIQTLYKLKWKPGPELDRSTLITEIGALLDVGTPYDIQKITVEFLDELKWTPGKSEVGARYWLVKGNTHECAACGESAIRVWMQKIGGYWTEEEVSAFAGLGAPAFDAIVNTTHTLLAEYLGKCAQTTSIDFRSGSDVSMMGKIKDTKAVLFKCFEIISHFTTPDAVRILNEIFDKIRTSLPVNFLGAMSDPFGAADLRGDIVGSFYRIGGQPAVQIVKKALSVDLASEVQTSAVNLATQLLNESPDLVIGESEIRNAVINSLYQKIAKAESQGYGSQTSYLRQKIREIQHQFDGDGPI
jgi:hypothetical protein